MGSNSRSLHHRTAQIRRRSRQSHKVSYQRKLVNMEKVLEFLKKAEFNSIMLALAIGAIASYFKIEAHPYNEIAFSIAIVASSYCIIRLVVFCFNKIKKTYELRKGEKRKNLARRKIEEQVQKERNVEISRMFDGLSENVKAELSDMVNNSVPDKYQNNVFRHKKIDFHQVDCCYQMQSITRIFRTDDPRIISYNSENGQPCITFSNYSDTITFTIDPYLLDLIKQYDKERKKSGTED